MRVVDSPPERALSDSEEKPPWRAAKVNEGGSTETSRRLASVEKGKNRAVRRKSDRLQDKCIRIIEIEGKEGSEHESPDL